MGSHTTSAVLRRTAAVCLAGVLWGAAAAAQDAPDAQDAFDAPAREAALRRGVEWLLAQQQRDGSWSYEERRHPSGQTALCAYTLLKAGVPSGHAAIRRARAYVEAELPATTYTLAVELMLAGALRDPALEARVRALVERLLDSGLEGEWGYPLTHAEPVWIDRAGPPDLSNTQYAVLGLRAAAQVGVDVPKRLWQDVFERTLEYQESPRAIDPELLMGRKVSGRVDAAGFCYVRDGSRGPSGSMTAAGLTVLGIAREMLGKSLGARRERELAESREHATRWLAANWSVTANPGEAGWHKYYLYGLERVGAVWQVEEYFGRRWFEEGAAELVTTQAENGSWGDSNPDTCFALLFLARATQAASGEGRELPRDTFASDEAQPLQVLGTGQPAITLWLRAPTAALRALHPGGLHVERVEYLVDGEVAAAPATIGAEPWENQSYPAKFEFTERGPQSVRARVHLAAPEGGAPSVLESAAFEVDVRYPLEPWMLDFAAARTKNLLRGVEVSATASSQVTGHDGPSAAVDGLQGTRWLVGEGDELPWLRLELARKVKAGVIVFSQATPREFHRGHTARFARAELLLDDDRKPIEVVFETDEMKPTRVVLDPPRSIQRLELRLVERTSAISWPHLVGIGEVALER
ncbi:MAG TPA: hypothetical protein VMT18_04180 [Planctomycetota bacterium]|nr:hypothetical protein [Planctomycetota bacterium]